MFDIFLLSASANCRWQLGDGVGPGGSSTEPGTFNVEIGTFSGPAECLAKCNSYTNQGKIPNGATVDAATGRKCWCEFGASGIDKNYSWKTCIFEPGKHRFPMT